jgi:hypothetical protein
MDVCLAFFTNLYSVRDWLTKSDASLTQPIADLFHQNQCLQLSRDIANGSKHLTLSRASVDGHYLTAREYVPPLVGGGEPSYALVILADGEKFDALALAKECVGAWQTFLDDAVAPSRAVRP